MTTIPEKKRPFDILAGFLIIVLGLAAARGAQNAPIPAAVMATLALGILIMWLTWRRKPAAMLRISPDEIVYGRLDQPGVRLTHDGSGRLRLRQPYNRGGWYLSLADAPGQPGISMIGFDLWEVQRACVAHGWTFV